MRRQSHHSRRVRIIDEHSSAIFVDLRSCDGTGFSVFHEARSVPSSSRSFGWTTCSQPAVIVCVHHLRGYAVLSCGTYYSRATNVFFLCCAIVSSQIVQSGISYLRDRIFGAESAMTLQERRRAEETAMKEGAPERVPRRNLHASDASRR